MPIAKLRITLTVIGPVLDNLTAPLTPILKSVFNADVGTVPALPLPRPAYDRSRDQYLSTALLDALAEQKQLDWARLLGIAAVDLFVPELNFVFGEADERRGVAVFSVARLRTPDRDTFTHRAATEAIHELGHTFGLTHCADARCVMWFSNTLAETDRKGTEFCAAHMRALQKRIERSRYK